MNVFDITWMEEDVEGPAPRFNSFRILAEDEEEAFLVGERFLNHHRSNPFLKVVRFVEKHKESERIKKHRSDHVAKSYCDYCGYMSPWYRQYGISYNPNFLIEKRRREAVSK